LQLADRMPQLDDFRLQLGKTSITLATAFTSRHIHADSLRKPGSYSCAAL
jgi:hypothetical protein